MRGLARRGSPAAAHPTDAGLTAAGSTAAGPTEAERGDVPAVVVIVPAILGLIALIGVAGHLEAARQVTAQAAEDAARAATLTRSLPAAEAAAGAEATSDLSPSCARIGLHLTGSLAPGSTVRVTVACTTTLGVVPGTVTVTSSATSVVSPYRASV